MNWFVGGVGGGRAAAPALEQQPKAFSILKKPELKRRYGREIVHSGVHNKYIRIIMIASFTSYVTSSS